MREQPPSCYDFMAKGLVHAKKMLDPQRPMGFWIFIISCMIAVSVDPLFFYVPFIKAEMCLGIDRRLRASAIMLYAVFGFFYMIYVTFLLPNALAKNEVKPCLCFSLIDIVVIFPLPLVLLNLVVDITTLRYSVFLIPLSLFLFQYLLRVIRISTLFTKATRTSGILAKPKWAKAVFNLLLYMNGGHVFGALWYFFAIEVEILCWKEACLFDNECITGSGSFFCDDSLQYYSFRYTSCPTRTPYNATVNNVGIFSDAFDSGVLEAENFQTRLLYCLRWGLQSLSCFGQNLRPTIFLGENFFVICITIYSVVVFVLLVGNMQTYLQSENIKSEEMRLRAQETEQWMPFWKLPGKLQKEVKRFRQPYKWPETKGADVENLINKLPKDLRKNIKCELCLELLRKVEEFGNLSESSLEDLCDLLKPVSFIERSRIVREGDPIDEMLFVVQGKLRTYTSRNITAVSSTTDHRNRKNNFLKDGDFCGKELVTCVHADPYSSSLPISTRTIVAVTNAEAFALTADDLQNLFVKHHAVRFIQSFWRFRTFLRSRRNVHLMQILNY